MNGQWNTINMNDAVRVKFTPIGLAELKRQHDEFKTKYPSTFNREWTPPKVDADGWSEYTLWSLMQDLGHLCGNGLPVPFETAIQVRTTADEPKMDGESIWLLAFADQEAQPPLAFSGAGADAAALRKFERASDMWTCRLFRCVAQSGYGPPQTTTGKQQPREPGASLVAGDTLPTTLAQFEARANRLLEDEQAGLMPDNALIAFICDAVRLARENERLAKSPVETRARTGLECPCGKDPDDCAIHADSSETTTEVQS